MCDHHQKRQINGRAAIFLLIESMRFLSIGLIALFSPRAFGHEYRIIEQIASLSSWGWILVISSLLLILSVILDRAKFARIMLVEIFTITALWGISFIVDIQLGSTWIYEPVLWLSIAFVDAIVISMPFSQPVYDLLKEHPEIVSIARKTRDGGHNGDP